MDFFKFFNNFKKKEVKDSSTDEVVSLKRKLETIRALLAQYNLDLDPDTLQIRPLGSLTPTTFRASEKLSSAYYPSIDELFDIWKNYKRDDSLNFSLVVEDMDKLYYESPIFSRAMNFIADEILQTNYKEETIEIKAKTKELEDEIKKLFKRIKIEEVLRTIALDLVRYGNAVFIILTDNEGISGLSPINPSDLRDIYCFKPYEVSTYLKDSYNSNIINQTLNDEKFHILSEIILEDLDDYYSAYFKKYLFGYRIGEDFLVPPWRILHIRNYYSSSPFGEYGIPLFIHAVAPYKQYDMAISLQMAARKARLPLLKYKLKFQGNLSPTEKQERALEFLRDLENSGLAAVRREGIGIGERVVTIEDLYDIEEEVPNLDIGKVDDLNLLYEDLYLASLVPRGFIDPNNQTFGNSGVALKQQFIPFARLILRLQLSILDGLTSLVKNHLILKGYPEESLDDFILSLPFPETQYSQELISSNESALSLANNILDSISQKLGIQGPLPPELVFTVYKTFLPIESQKLNNWFLKYLDVIERTKVEQYAQTKGQATPGAPQKGGFEGGFGGGFGGGGDLFGGGGGLGGGLGGMDLEGGGDAKGGFATETGGEAAPTETPAAGGAEKAGGENVLTASLKISALKYLPKSKEDLKLLNENKEKFSNIDIKNYLLESDFKYFYNSKRLFYKSYIEEKDKIHFRIQKAFVTKLLKESENGKPKNNTNKRK